MAAAVNMTPRATMSQRQVARLSYKMWMGLNLLKLPIKDLHEELKRQIDTNPALADCKFNLPPNWRPEVAGSLSGDNAFMFENRAAEESLYEHLIKQGAPDFIAGNLDENGRYDGPELDDAGEKARQEVMQMDPLGCGAKTLGECYMAQISKIPHLDRPAAVEVIKKLDDILAGKAKLTPELQVMAAKLLSILDAKPGSHFGEAPVAYIVPDVIVGRDGLIKIEHGTIPEIRVSPSYANMATDHEQSDEVRKYAQEMVGHVKELKSAVDKRFETLETVARAIVEKQRDYIMGTGKLKQLLMKDVANAAHVSTSTISRTAERKYLRGPKGLIRLRDLFYSHDDALETYLKKLFADGATKKLSDQKIANMMTAAGFKIARRTVNKRRKEYENESL